MAQAAQAALKGQGQAQAQAQVELEPPASEPRFVTSPLRIVEQAPQRQFRIDVLSDTHGVLPPAAFRACAGADLIVHAGDICGDDIIVRLEMQAPVIAVLGNNDWPGAYGPDVRSEATFERLGITFKVTHIPSRLPPLDTRIAICGHTHVAQITEVGACTVVNPGSVSRPRGGGGPTMARIILEENFVRSAVIVRLGANEG